MAASLLRLGGKILQQSAWSFRAAHPTTSLCTKSGRSKKEPTKNIVAAEKKVVQVDKHAVEPPKKSSPSSHPSAAAAGETIAGIKPRVADKGVTQFPPRKTLVVFPARAPFSAVGGALGTVSAAVDEAKEKKTEEEKPSSSISSISDSDSSSSSESDSSSSSDSEGEEDAAADPVKTKVEFPVRGPNLKEMHDVNKGADQEGKVPPAMKKQTIHAGPDLTVLPGKQHRDSHKSPKGDGTTAISHLTISDKLRSTISKPTKELRLSKPATKVDSLSGSPETAAHVRRPTKPKVFKKGATVGVNLESPRVKGLPEENHEEVMKDQAPVIVTEAIAEKPSPDSSMQGASLDMKESITSRDCATQREEIITPPRVESAKSCSMSGETLEPRAVPEIDGEILEPGSAPDKATEIQAASTIPDKATEILAASTIPDKATEIQSASTIPDKATEIQAASTIPDDKATEIQAISTIPDKATGVLETELTPDKDTEMLETSTTSSQVAETLDSKSTPSKDTEEQGPSSDVITETGELSTPQGTEAAADVQEQVFDNSTYRNLQHHSFTPFTFIDIDMELSKFRLPQPSSGRPSPRH